MRSPCAAIGIRKSGLDISLPEGVAPGRSLEVWVSPWKSRCEDLSPSTVLDAVMSYLSAIAAGL